MTNRHYYQKVCDYCNEQFDASRYDARFCSTKCRTAHHRRRKRREQAATAMTTAWDDHTRQAYAEISNAVPGYNDTIKDIFIKHSPQAAADAVAASYSVFNIMTNKAQRELQQKDKTIDQLTAQLETLNQIKQLLRP